MSSLHNFWSYFTSRVTPLPGGGVRMGLGLYRCEQVTAGKQRGVAHRGVAHRGAADVVGQRATVDVLGAASVRQELMRGEENENRLLKHHL